MLEDEICNLRKQLDESVITGKNYEEIYNLSIKLDVLIAKYYIKRGKSKK